MLYVRWSKIIYFPPHRRDRSFEPPSARKVSEETASACGLVAVYPDDPPSDERGLVGGDEDDERRAQFDDLCIPLSSDASTGSLRRRFPVRAKIAFTTAGAIVDVPGSPIPPGSSLLSTMWTSTAGASSIRRGR